MEPLSLDASRRIPGRPPSARGSGVFRSLGLWGLFVAVYALASLQQTTPSRAAFALVTAELLLGVAVVVPLAIFLGRDLP